MSAASFMTPAMFSAGKATLDGAHVKKRHLSRCIAIECMLACVLVNHDDDSYIVTQALDMATNRIMITPPYYGTRDSNW